MSIPMEMSGSEMVDQPVLQPDLGGQAMHNERPQRPQARHPDRHLGEIEPEEIKLFDVLGAGQYGTVRKGIVREQEVAVKIFHRQDLNNKDILDFKMEVEAFFNVGGHPNLLMCMGACLRPGKLAIIMELLPKNKTLEDILSSPDLPLPLTTRLIWALEIAKGMLWIHTAQPNMVIHKDLKPANICIDSHQHVKVFDLGLSSIKPNDSTLVAGRHANGSPLWMAPESLLKKPFDEKVDVYSFAICLWQIITRKQPFASHNDLPRFIKAICINQERPPIREEWGQRICNLLKLSWHPIPRFRPDFNQIITQLNSLIIETSINDKDGQQLWASKWIDKQVVAWPDFFSWFAQKTGFSIPFNLENCKRYRCLKKLLVAPHPDYSGPGAPEVVSVQRFGYFLDCFGPLFDRTMVPVSSSSSSAMVDLGSSSNAQMQEVVRSNCVHRMIKACHQPWFCGFLTREEVEQKLSDYVSGSFLVRISDRSDRFDQPNRAFFVISSIRDNRFFHHRVNFRADIGFSTQVSNAAHNETRTIISNFPDQSLRAFILQVFYDLNLTYGVTDGTFLDISNKNVPKDSGYTDAMISAMSDEVDDDDDVSDAEAQAELAYIGDSNE